MVLAFSLQSDVKSIGAYAGFAAMIGLALLVLLYFAQAREIRRLSDWLEQQEDRLRNLPARTPAARPLPAAPAARVAPPPAVLPLPEPGAAPTATVAVPGVRRVAVGAGGAVTPAAAAAQADAAAGGAGAAATVAGALAPASAAGRAASETIDETDDTVPPNRLRAPAAADPGEATPPPAAGASEPPAPVPEGGAFPSAAVPLTARPPASAEPLGGAQVLGVDNGGSGASPDSAEATPGGPPAPAPGAVAALEPAEGVIARPPPPEPGSQAAVEAPFASGEAFEISAGRVAAPAAGPTAPPLFDGELEGAPSPGSDGALEQELPALAPSTPAGARPRFPPAPVAERATPVGVTARAGVGVAAAAGGAATVAADAAATTRRRERDRLPGAGAGAGEDERHGRGSLLRLLAATVVIVLVLAFIATKVFAPAKTTGLIPSKVVVAVLNGTHVGGLAGKAAVKLSAGGFLRGGVANALSQGHHVTLVSYTPGNLAAAKLVAKDLIPTRTLVGPVDSRTAELADSLGATAPNVIVTLGSDYLPQ